MSKVIKFSDKDLLPKKNKKSFVLSYNVNIGMSSHNLNIDQ